jgi:hypothetical protein
MQVQGNSSKTPPNLRFERTAPSALPLKRESLGRMTAKGGKKRDEKHIDFAYRSAARPFRLLASTIATRGPSFTISNISPNRSANRSTFSNRNAKFNTNSYSNRNSTSYINPNA